VIREENVCSHIERVDSFNVPQSVPEHFHSQRLSKYWNSVVRNPCDKIDGIAQTYKRRILARTGSFIFAALLPKCPCSVQKESEL